MSLRSLGSCLLLTAVVSANTALAAEAEPGHLPKAQAFPAQIKAATYSLNDLFSFRALPKYHEPGWVHDLVRAGKLPPVEQRLPKEPLVYNHTSMPDGIGHYGGVFRHVIGGRPQGWNWAAGQTQGWGGINIAMMECLTRTGPMVSLNKEDQQPLPNLAKSWEWSKDGKQLTMHLIEGARWSDGVPFTADDVMFHWRDNILDPKVPSWAQADTFGIGTKLEKIDDYTVRWTFKKPNNTQALFQMAFMNFCPGPAHLLKPKHPKYNPKSSYTDYVNALPTEKLPAVTMGAWVPVEYKPDELIVMRRNPYFWKVDDQGNQLPYIDEMQFKLSTWSDRTVQAIAGSADISNMEDPSLYVSSLKRAAQKEAPARLAFGPRTLGWSLMFNFADRLGAEDNRELAVRKLNRTLKFRQALSHAIDRKALGQSLVRGPFTQPYAGGIYPEGPVGDAGSVVYYGYKPALARKLLDDLGLRDTDGDGIRNWTDGPMKGQDVQIALAYKSDYATDAALAEGVISMLREVGIKLIPKPAQTTQVDALRDSSRFEMAIQRTDKDFIIPMQQAPNIAPMNPNAPAWHHGSADYPQKLLPFETKLRDLMNEALTERDPAAQAKDMDAFNHVFTSNVYMLGLTTAPGALVVNKRIRNVPPGTPIVAYQWAEDSIMRERLWVDDTQPVAELRPHTLPGL